MVWLIAVLILGVTLGFFLSWKIGLAVGGISLILLIAFKARGGRSNGGDSGGFLYGDSGGGWDSGGASDGGGDCGGGDGGGDCGGGDGGGD